MYHEGDPRQTAVSDLSKVILCPVAPRFEHSTLIVRAKQHNYSAIAANVYDIYYSQKAPKHYSYVTHITY